MPSAHESAGEIAAEAESLRSRMINTGAGVDPATVSEVRCTLALVARLARLVDDGTDQNAATEDTEVQSPRRIGAGDGIEKGILTAGDLRRILHGVSDDIMVVVYDTQRREEYVHVDVVERPRPDPTGVYTCSPDGPQLLVLNTGEAFDTRDY